MTCREKLKKERADCIGDMYTGGCKGCPSDYGYLEPPEDYMCTGNDPDCARCWDRDIPEVTVVNEQGVLKSGPNDDPWEPRPAFPTAPQILDSGDRTRFETGAVRDMREGKGRCDLMPLEVVAELMGDNIIPRLKRFLEFKNTKYLYTILADFAKFYDDGKTKSTPDKICQQRYCTMFLEVAKHFEDGAKKYGENNWQKGIPVHCYIDSAVRHYLKWLRGDKDEPHDRAFVWNIMCCIWEVDYHKTTVEATNG